MRRHPLTVLLALCVLSLSQNARAAPAPNLPPPLNRPIDFDKDVQPIFAKSCYSCHGDKKQKGGYRLDIAAAALAGGDDGIAIIPKNGVESPLIHYVAGLDPDRHMPPKGDPLTKDQVAILRTWIDQGAQWPQAAGATDPKLDHWAFKPLTNPSIPNVKNAEWARNPIDSFVFAKLQEKGLTPSAPADKRTLLRRVTFDLTGLPPDPRDLESFLQDESPAAYEKVVDRLLASPRYGERWARHWMDVIHFAETHGNDQDRERPNAWPYRDYLVQSFNADKPYARFVEEQLAGDSLYPSDAQGIVALGFIAAGPWDESSQMEIQEDTTDKKVARNLDRDDMVTTTMASFTSTTVHCARCHAHKFDPIAQADYYGLQSVFAGVDRADRPYDSDPTIRDQRRKLLAQKRALDSGQLIPGASPLDPETQSKVAAWENSLAVRSTHWTPLDPATFASSGGATLTKQPDLSILASGKRPDVDTYTINASTDLKAITAVRLELLTDDSLPHKGPGRQDNGNLHLNEFKLLAAPKATPEQKQPIDLSTARADFDQQGWTIAMSIDHNPQTAWGIYPAIGKPHVGVYELKQPTNFETGTLLTFILEQTHGDGHLIGRFRLSVTTAPPPLPAELELLPSSITQILAIQPTARTESQRRDLATYYLKDLIDRRLKSLPPPQMVYAAASDFDAKGNFKPAAAPRPVFILRRGDINNPMEPAAPRALACVPGLPSDLNVADPKDESSRRAALAKWISNPRNSLTWRSIVNRVWHYHFGRGIVATPNDFGHMGTPPTHPELLDYLATWFLDHGGSLKQLHRLIVTSNAYRQSSDFNADYAKIDADNQYLWRMNRTRLDAESVRDAVLQITGLLDTTMGGPSAKQFTQKPGVHVTPVLDYAAFDVDSPASRRLSIYRFIYRTLPDPFMDAMDCPDASQLTPARNISVTALQALAMFNDRFIIRYSEHLAARAANECPDLPAQITRVYELCLNRQPTNEESATVAAYAHKHGLSNACRILLNSNEFLFVD